MNSGAIFPSYAADVSWSAYSGGWSTDYPLANVKDLVRISNPARASSTGDRAIGGVMTAARTLQGIALVGHNIPAGILMRVYAFSGTGYDPTANAGQIVYDSGLMAVWPTGGPVEGLRAIRPVIPPAPVVARSVLIVVYGMATPLEIQAIEIGAFWAWPGVSYNREMGVAADDQDIAYAGGAVGTKGVAKARIVRGQMDFMAMGKTSTIGLDFQKGLDIKTPFVWSEDFPTPSAWARKCMLVRNQELPHMVGVVYRHDAFPIRLIEHLR